ncbi:MAG: helix-turn-helix transcriptional regulator [Coriobacteriia bacterium]|nr:helix-turn-helix transcriptional regulator [Coriobacteriia bacterium]
MAEERNPCTEFGKRLRELRLERGLSQEQLGELSGLDRTYISSAEAGRRNVSLKTICKLAEALGVEAGTLVSSSAQVTHEPSTG